MNRLEKVALSCFALIVVGVLIVCYSMSWGERLLRPVEIGMSQNRVRALVGSPLRSITRSNATDAWYYDRWWSSDAVVYFDTNRLVSAVETD